MMDTQLESDPVRRSTKPDVNAKIDDDIRETVERYASASPELISQRIGVLEEEWDIERVLETNASTLALTGVLLGALGYRRGTLLSLGVLGFLLTHATRGWCPPLPLLRRLGVRTRREIEREKFVLKYLRGDFDELIRARKRSPDAALAVAG